MHFTTEDKKMIVWLQKQHENWRSVRVIILGSSALCLAFAVLEFFQRGYGALPLLLLVIAMYGASYTLGSWSGRPEISLLLKLIEAEKTSSDTSATE